VIAMDLMRLFLEEFGRGEINRTKSTEALAQLFKGKLGRKRGRPRKTAGDLVRDPLVKFMENHIRDDTRKVGATERAISAACMRFKLDRTSVQRRWKPVAQLRRTWKPVFETIKFVREHVSEAELERMDDEPWENIVALARSRARKK
jgi:hypothetical protein